ncbi:hypothetical protein FPOA_12139 [Fusarium poae]|uniref:Uncharacterized protein n=1 Tax=Fusarium poae TaxID=36050 RepID=A0A1B8AA87_FUSPO|nr:hypothetical protein FPOA_12786 [Fusarium poae]OBS16594.1 hypothetical protein FPOA_12784 [Fusarium poae]OBS17375.1 hypothetical protein FPOA_12139 [Fusarium poae]
MITARFVLLQTQRAIWEERIQKAPYCPPPPPRSHKEEKALVDVQNAFNKGGRLARFSTYLDMVRDSGGASVNKSPSHAEAFAGIPLLGSPRPSASHGRTNSPFLLW